ncbi:hypothetical protein F5Y00DRAFT_272906 [Daldinia vernicosa]|uniref:uncharacterized protein n=1 Tax=Daldinia vernicosa TaxID=114800 RepID=UPI0020081B65|nr:uncharacterized protein F5Y00DRAFT_272906 [Daldinia vernicosa]KAI0845360.1 hypothetical protein F5Y00DRAFT_272906 [Daldinia vernicosa]
MNGDPSVKDGKKSFENVQPSHTALQHQTAVTALANLPLKTVVSVFRHQWHKDKARITFAHAEQYMREHDLPTVRTEWPNLGKYRPRHWRVHHFQRRLLKEDLVRLPKKDPITQSKAHSIRSHFSRELRVSLPNDLAKVYYGKIPACMDDAIDPGEFINLVDHFGAERHPMILTVPISLHLWSVHQDYPDLLPKKPAP